MSSTDSLFLPISCLLMLAPACPVRFYFKSQLTQGNRNLRWACISLFFRRDGPIRGVPPRGRWSRSDSREGCGRVRSLNLNLDRSVLHSLSRYQCIQIGSSKERKARIHRGCNHRFDADVHDIFLSSRLRELLLQRNSAHFSGEGRRESAETAEGFE